MANCTSGLCCGPDPVMILRYLAGKADAFRLVSYLPRGNAKRGLAEMELVDAENYVKAFLEDANGQRLAS